MQDDVALLRFGNVVINLEHVAEYEFIGTDIVFRYSSSAVPARTLSGVDVDAFTWLIHIGNAFVWRYAGATKDIRAEYDARLLAGEL
ncbi:MAG: hypothetical protein HC911_18030 [Chloroflexaceae bacterium]|nr:hypothetical protein [Chloroflexaceae bacterium]